MKDVKELVRRHWDWRSANFDEEPSHGLLNDAQARAWRGLIARIAGPAPLGVIDAGCGTGFLSILFAEAGHQVTGVDFAPAILVAARAIASARGLEVNFMEGDAESISLPSARPTWSSNGMCFGPCRIRNWRCAIGASCCAPMDA